MISINQVKKEYANVEGQISGMQLTSRQLSNRKKRLIFLREAIKYLGSGPSEDFIKSEKLRLRERVKAIMANYGGWDTRGKSFNNDLVKEKSYKKHMGVLEIQEQLKMIDYLLGHHN